MKVNGKDYRTVWMEGNTVLMVEQNLLPYRFSIHACHCCADTCEAIRTMIIRGAGAIGAAAGYAMAQAFAEAPAEDFERYVKKAKQDIESTRPTARNLFYATDRVFFAGMRLKEAAREEADAIADRDASDSQAIGEFGNTLIRDGFHIQTHCNAGWLAFVDYGTALSPIYRAHRDGKQVFVWVDETRPRSQGARLTAWELQQEGVRHRIVPDNAGAWLMSQGRVDMMITGADRIAANGDTANKIGTFEKAIVAKTFGIPFYIAAPTSTIDGDCKSGKEIVIEQRSAEEVLYQTGPDRMGKMHEVLVASPGSDAINPAFDVTPAEYITGIITEKGIIRPTAGEIARVID